MPVHERVCENPAVVRVGRPGDAHVSPERIGPKLSRENLCPTDSVNEGVVVDLVEVVAAIVVRVLHERADHVGRRVLETLKTRNKSYREKGGGMKKTRQRR